MVRYSTFVIARFLLWASKRLYSASEKLFRLNGGQPERWRSVRLKWKARKLGPLEREVVDEIAQRVKDGQDKYGKLTIGKKNWTKEAKEEVLDLCVYMAMVCKEAQATEELGE